MEMQQLPKPDKYLEVASLPDHESKEANTLPPFPDYQFGLRHGP